MLQSLRILYTLWIEYHILNINYFIQYSIYINKDKPRFKCLYKDNPRLNAVLNIYIYSNSCVQYRIKSYLCIYE